MCVANSTRVAWPVRKKDTIWIKGFDLICRGFCREYMHWYQKTIRISDTR